jgi:hypothetical protein
MNMASAAPPISVRLARAQLITRVFTADLSLCAQCCRTGFVPFEYCHVKLKNSGDPMGNSKGDEAYLSFYVFECQL